MKKEASGGVLFRFSVGTRGTAAAHVRYIMRSTATDNDLAAVSFQNLGGINRDSASFREVRKRAIEYAREKEKIERARPCQGRGKARTFYRLILSFEGREKPERALALAGQFLSENFPLARAISAVHSDTQHTHIHINLFARLTTDRKIQLKESEYTRLDESWARIYAREFGAQKLTEYLHKKEETAAAKREYFAGLSEIENRAGISGSEREQMRADFKDNFRWPERVDYRMTRERIRERDRQNHDQSGVGRDQRETQSRDHQVEERGRGEGRAGTAAERATRGAGEALRGLERAAERSREISDRGERLYSRERERDRGR